MGRYLGLLRDATAKRARKNGTEGGTGVGLKGASEYDNTPLVLWSLSSRSQLAK